jgi:hypothetical protein
MKPEDDPTYALVENLLDNQSYIHLDKITEESINIIFENKLPLSVYERLKVPERSNVIGWRFIDKQGHMELTIKTRLEERLEIANKRYAGPHRSRRLAKRWATRKMHNLGNLAVRFVSLPPLVVTGNLNVL